MTATATSYLRPRSRPRLYGTLLLPVGVLLVGAGLAFFAGQLDVDRSLREKRADVRLQLSAVAARAQSHIRSAFSETEGIAQLIGVDGDISAEHFVGMTRQIVAEVPYLHHIALAPGDVVRMIVPVEGNEAAIGLDYRQRPDQYPMLRRARALGEAVLAGPLNLYQGGRALVYRRPVFLSNHKGALRYWGMLSAIADIDGLLAASGLSQNQGLDLALRGSDGAGASGQLIWGDVRLFGGHNVTVTFEVPGGHWQLAAQPKGGWPTLGLASSPQFLLGMAATLILSLLCGLLSRGHLTVQKRNQDLKREVAERQQAEADLARLAHFDAVTGLPNRVLFHHRLAQSIQSVEQRGGHLAVLLLDIDGFKLINDTLGHAHGDLLLQEATARLADQIRPWDVVARLGGDEFAFVLDRLQQPLDAGPVVQRLLLSLRQPFDLNGNAALVSASIGIALCPADGNTVEDLLRHADTAMYSAKEAGRDAFRFYQPEMTVSIQRRVELEHALRRALLRKEFEVWYQPKIHLESNQVNGAEALLRWRDPVKGLVFPDQFIPLAERTGLIIPMGEWLLDEVCGQIRRWRDLGQFCGQVAINVATPQIERSDFVTSVRQALKRYGLPPSVLEVEVTESLLMESQALACDVLGQLRALGVRTAIDDFGTGHSSLAYLKLLPVDHLKMDRAFVRDLPDDRTYVAITQAIVALGKALDFSVTAEGIETPAQLEFLRQAGCAGGQGYLIGKPMPAEAFQAWLKAHASSLA